MSINRRWLIILYYSVIFCILFFPINFNVEFIKSIDLPYSENSDFFTMLLDHSNLILTLIGILTAFVSFVSVFGRWLTSKLLKDVNIALETHKTEVGKSFTKQDKILVAQNITMNNITNDVKHIVKAIEGYGNNFEKLEEKFSEHLIWSAKANSTIDSKFLSIDEKLQKINKDFDLLR